MGAAGILKGSPATTHWYKMGVLQIMGAKPHVRSGKIITATGVSAGIDLALWLSGTIAGREGATSSPSNTIRIHHSMLVTCARHLKRCKASPGMDDRMPADQGRLVPKIAWRRFIDLIRTGK